jgi:hypothetical protein
VLALASTLGACATVTRGTTTKFTIDSSPPAAQVRTSTGFTCEATPCTFKMPRKENFVLTVSKAGYKTATLPIDSKLAGNGAAGFLGNALIGGVIGAGVDIASGAMDDLTPNPAHVTLEAETAVAPVAPVTPKTPEPAVIPAAATVPALPAAGTHASPSAMP